MSMKGLFGTLVGTVVGMEAIKAVGNTDFRFKDATQTFIGLGILANAANNTKGFFKFK